jgi:hypothetical protein
VGQEPRHLTLRTTMRQRITRGVPSCCSSGTRPVHRSALRLHGARQRRRPRELGAGPDHDRPRADILRGRGGPDSVGTGPAPMSWTPRKEATTSRRRCQRSGLGAPRTTCCTVTPAEGLYGQVADDALAGVPGGTDSTAAGERFRRWRQPLQHLGPLPAEAPWPTRSPMRCSVAAATTCSSVARVRTARRPAGETAASITSGPRKSSSRAVRRRNDRGGLTSHLLRLPASTATAAGTSFVRRASRVLTRVLLIPSGRWTRALQQRR